MSTESNIHCWLDCDPGHDDTFAILLAAYNPRIKLIGISTVSGNQTIEKTTQNALKALNLFNLIQPVEIDSEEFDKDLTLNNCSSHGGLICPLLSGSGRPLLRAGKICDEIHGESGLDTHVTLNFPELPETARKYVENMTNQDIHFTTLMYKHFKQNGKPVTLIATGPLTNVALLLINHPDSYKYIEKIVLMGGAMGIGNTGAVAEFNIQVDPEAASYVFESHLVPIYMVPLEITHQALVTSDVLNSIDRHKSNLSKILVELLLFFKTTYKDVFFMDQPPLHDPCAVAFVIDPSIFECRLMRVDVETSSNLSYGQTVCDVYKMSTKKKNVHVCTKMDVDKFWSMMTDAIEKANEASPVNKIK